MCLKTDFTKYATDQKQTICVSITSNCCVMTTLRMGLLLLSDNSHISMRSSISNLRQSGSHANLKIGRSLSRKRAGVPGRECGDVPCREGGEREAAEEPMQTLYNLHWRLGELGTLVQATCKLGSWCCRREFLCGYQGGQPRQIMDKSLPAENL